MGKIMKNGQQYGGGDSLPSGGTADQVLKKNSSGTAEEWSSLKTINGQSIFGTGDIQISGGSGVVINASAVSGPTSSMQSVTSTQMEVTVS